MDLSKFEMIPGTELPKDIKEIKDDILNKVVLCEKRGKPFQIIKSELDFHRQMNLPLPTIHPLSRLMERFQKRNPYRLWKVSCAKCGQETDTSYGPVRKLKIYCESCYLKEVI